MESGFQPSSQRPYFPLRSSRGTELEVMGLPSWDAQVNRQLWGSGKGWEESWGSGKWVSRFGSWPSALRLDSDKLFVIGTIQTNAFNSPTTPFSYKCVESRFPSSELSSIHLLKRAASVPSPPRQATVCLGSLCLGSHQGLVCAWPILVPPLPRCPQAGFWPLTVVSSRAPLWTAEQWEWWQLGRLGAAVVCRVPWLVLKTRLSKICWSSVEKQHVKYSFIVNVFLNCYS